MNRILIAVDGSDSCLEALERGVELARAWSSDIELLHVAPISAADMLSQGSALASDPSLLQQLGDRLRAEGQRILDQALQKLQGKGLLVTTRLLLGHPGNGICEVAESDNVRCVVVGSRGHSRWQTLLLGSVSRFVLDHCAVPVLVVRPPAAQEVR